ncbi:hypothetical protein TCAL_17333 [Tigriopus californicus]|uniref:NADH dehydrogenase [ubiquinone] 1 alpha subcomplex subunit 12 n=1 Tax=Tigriopus californicus TaxID=6832 RepID=A0A553NYH2_TIGCA|nr:hypothetical protein TCAL_17333 [Tigriopus californicus]
MSLGKFLGLDKVGRLQAIIRHNGGLWNSLKTLYRTDDLKIGTLVGEDRYGNKYYENPTYFYVTLAIIALEMTFTLPNVFFPLGTVLESVQA